MTDDKQTSGRRLKSVDRAFDIIEFLQQQGPLSLSEIADELDLPMSTAHIYLSTLVESRYVIESNEGYHCSLQFLRAGGERRDRLPLFQAAKKEVDDLSDTLEEHANVVTIEDGYMVQLYKSENESSIDDNALLGAHLYLHLTATGKAMLAELSEEEVEGVIDSRGLPEQTAATITDRDELFDELAETRERGYAINSGEHFAGVRAVAVPILSNDGEVLGAISVSGPTSRMKPERIEDEIAPALFDKKNIIELKINRPDPVNR